MKLRSVIDAGFSLAYLMISLLGLWLTLGWRVRRTRKAFEKELIKQGMTKENAERLSAQFSKLKDQITSSLRKGIAF